MKGEGVSASSLATAERMDARPRQFSTGAPLVKLVFFAAIALGATTLAAQQPDAGLRKAIQSALGPSAGGGATIPAGITGGFTRLDSLAPLALPVTVMIGSTAIEATLSYHGAAPTLSTGVFQINFEIPAGAPARPSVSLSIAIGSVKSTDPPAGTTIALK